jgi:hypothetical protein
MKIIIQVMIAGESGYIDPFCAAYECSLDYNNASPTNSIYSTAKSPETWNQKLGLTTLDEINLYQHIQTGEPYHDPFFSMLQYIAGDLDGNGLIETNDQDLLHSVLLNQSVVAGQHYGDIVDTWNFIPQYPYLLSASGDYFDALSIYEPSSEAYFEMWEDFPGAFNHYANGGLYYQSFALGNFAQDSYGWYTWGVKIGDLNFSYIHGLSCLYEDVPILDELGGAENSEVLVRSIPIKEAPLLSTVVFESSNSAIVDFKVNDLTSLLGLQLYFKLTEGVSNVELLTSKLPGFDANDLYVDLTKGVFNIVWFDPNMTRNRVDNEMVLLRFRLTGEIGSTPLFYENSSERSLFINFEKQEIPVVLELTPSRSSGLRFMVTPNPCSEFVVFDNLETGHIAITFYDISGKVVYKTFEELTEPTYSISFDDTMKKPGMLFYHLENGGQIYQGKLLTTE